MSRSAQTRSRKRLKLLVIIGLPITLLVALILWLIKRRGWLKVFRTSEYRSYEPWLIAQSKHETSNWKSSLFKNHKSLFGMKMSERVDWDGYTGPVSPEGNNYAGYFSYEDSAQHLLNWLRYNHIPANLQSVDDYVKAIRSKGYFTDTLDNYINGVKRFL